MTNKRWGLTVLANIPYLVSPAGEAQDSVRTVYIDIAKYCDTVGDCEDNMMGMSFPSITINVHNTPDTDTQ